MAIKGRTDQPSDKKGYPLLGRIYKGTPKRKVKRKSDGKEVEIMGQDTDEFRVEFELGKIEKPTAEETILLQHYKDQWVRVYGERPRRFDDVRLYFPTPDRAMESWFEQWDNRGLVTRCNGETKQRWWDDRAKRYSNEPAACPFAAGGVCDCSPVARIPIILMKFSLLTGIMGYFQLTTHSNNDIDNLHAAMCEVFNVTGDLTKVVFSLTRVPTALGFVDEKTGERGKVTKSLLSLFGGQQYTQKYLVPPDHRQEYAAMLAGGDDETPRIAASKPPAVERFPMIPASTPHPDVDPVIVEQGEPDQPPPPRPTLTLKNMKVRTAFIVLSTPLGFDAHDILEVCGVSDFNNLEWYETAEALGIEIEPPAELWEKLK